jgi:arginase
MTAARGQIELIGVPMDLGANRRGVDMGPSALRIAGLQQKLEGLGYGVSDLGDIVVENRETLPVRNQKLKYVDEIVKTATTLGHMVQRSLGRGHFPLSIGGDHSMALGSIAGVSAHCRAKGIIPGVIWIDAHADMNTETTSPSGNIHGMPLAASMGLGNPELTGIGDLCPKVAPHHCALLALRSIDPEERQTIQSLRLTACTMSDIDRRGIGAVIREILDTLRQEVDFIHVSFDMDSVDPSVALGVGTPVRGGLTYREAHLIMETIAESGLMGSMDVAEVNPILDDGNRSAEFAAELVASSMGMRIL